MLHVQPFLSAAGGGGGRGPRAPRDRPRCRLPPAPSRAARPAAGELLGRSRSRRRGRAPAVRVPPSAAAGTGAAPGAGWTPAELCLARPGWQRRPEARRALSHRPACLLGRNTRASEDVCSRIFSEPPGRTQPKGSVCLPPRPAMPTVSSPVLRMCVVRWSLRHEQRNRFCRLPWKKQQVTTIRAAKPGFMLCIFTAQTERAPLRFAA